MTHILRFSTLVLLAVGLLQTACTSSPSKEPQYAGVALFPPIQDPDKGTPISLGRGSILWGDHDVVHGLDTSFVGNFVNKEFKGSALSGIFHTTRGTADINGWQVSLVLNNNLGKTRIGGVQFTAGVNYAGGDQRVVGVQMAALANIGMKNRVYGFQFGMYNEAEAIYGVQIGVLNRVKNLYGLQVGLLNFASKNGLAFFPVINAGF